MTRSSRGTSAVGHQVEQPVVEVEVGELAGEVPGIRIRLQTASCGPCTVSMLIEPTIANPTPPGPPRAARLTGTEWLGPGDPDRWHPTEAPVSRPVVSSRASAGESEWEPAER